MGSTPSTETHQEGTVNIWGSDSNKTTRDTGKIDKKLVKELKKYPWYVGNTHRAEAIALLMQNTQQVGDFLVRDSNTWENNFCLSVRSFKQAVCHYRIQYSQDKRFFILPEHTFPTLVKLIDNHCDQAKGLCATLRNPCKVPVSTKNKTIVFVPPVLTKGLEIDKNALKLKRRIDQGYFGEVYEGVWNSIPVAVKMLKKGSMEVESFKREAQLLKDVNHSNLIVLYGVSMRTEPFYIVTELMKNGSLLKYLRGPKGKDLKTDKLVKIASQVACGMEYLERKNVIHRDLAARNVLVGDDESFVIKIADFGMARWMNDQNYVPKNKKALFPIKWTSPEAASYGQFSIKSDVWSFGVLFMEIMTHGKEPYPGMSNEDTLSRIEQGYRMPCPTDCPGPVYDVMIVCWNHHPDRRPSFKMIREKLKTVLFEPVHHNYHKRFASRKIAPDQKPKTHLPINIGEDRVW